MGTIKVISGVDYSNVAIGKIDFNTNVFRRKIDGKLERNLIYLTGGYLNGYDKVDLSSDIIKVKTSFLFAKQNGECRLFSVSDYTHKRSFLSNHVISDNRLFFQIWFLNGTTAYSYNIVLLTDLTNLVNIGELCKTQLTIFFLFFFIVLIFC